MSEKEKRTIKALSIKKKAEGSIGFITTEEENRWFNVHGEEPALDELLKTVLQKGNIIEFDLEMGLPKNITVVGKAEKQETSGDMITFEELLADAHKKFEGGFTIKTELISHDAEKKQAVFKAIVEISTEGNCYEHHAHGDADQANCGDQIKQHYIRMAETRAISRALRWATNNATVAAEETQHGTIDPMITRPLTDEEMQQVAQDAHEES